MPSAAKPPAESVPVIQCGFLQSRWAVFAGGVILALATFSAYSNTFHAPFILDDTDSIIANHTLTSLRASFSPPPENGRTVSGRPALNVSLALNYAMSGLDVRSYHITNLAIHILAGLALFGLVRRTLRQPCFGGRFDKTATPLAWVIALIWCLHPLQTEAVTYVVQRAESLVGLFYLLTLYCFVRGAQSPARVWPALTVGACLLGMASKEVMVSAPLMVLLYDRTFVSGSFREAWRKRRMFYFSLAGTWLLLAWLMLSTQGRGSTVSFQSTLTWWQYAFTQTAAITRYLWLSFRPVGQIFDYGTYVVKTPAIIIPCSLFIAALVAGTAVALKRWPALGFLGAWFFMILAPSSSVAPIITQTVAEHRMYLPLAAVVVLVAIGLQRLTRQCTWILLLPVAVLAGFATFARNRVYGNAVSIWADTVDKNPGNPRAQSNLGVAYIDTDEIPKAIDCFILAIQLAPNYPEAHGNLGNALLKEGRVNESIDELAEAVRLDPNSSKIRSVFGNALFQARRLDESIDQFEKALALDSRNFDAHFNLANTLMHAGRLDEAAGQSEAALRLKPNDIETSNNYAVVLNRMGRRSEAITMLENVLRLDPDSAKAHTNLGLTLIMSGQTEPAIKHFAEAVRLEPDKRENHYNYANALVTGAQWAEAAEQYQILLKMGTPTIDLYNNLGAVYGQLGQLPEAARCFQEALKIDPNNAAAQENLARVETYLNRQGQP